MTCLSLTLCKTFKTFRKSFNSQDGWEKNSYPQISAEGYWQKQKMQVASKKVYWKNNRVFSELNRCIFKISLKYIKFVKNYVSFPPPQQNNSPLSTKIKISDPSPPAKTFLKFLTLPASWRGGGVHALLKLPKLLNKSNLKGPGAS